MAQITEIIMTAYERLQKLITDGDIYTKSQLDEKLAEIESKFGTEVAKALQDKINDGSLGALTIGDGTLDTVKFKDNSITTKKIVDGAITSNKMFSNTARLIYSNCLTIDMESLSATCTNSIRTYINGIDTLIASNGTIIPIPDNNHISLYVDLNDKKLKSAITSSITVPHLIVATVHYKARCMLYGNDKSIKFIDSSGETIGDITKSTSKYVNIPSTVGTNNTLNIIYTPESTTLTATFGGSTLYTFTNGIRRDVTMVIPYTNATISFTTGNYICYLDFTDNVIKFAPIKIKNKQVTTNYDDISESLDRGRGIGIICLIQLSRMAITDYIGCWDTVTLNGNNTELYRAINSQNNNGGGEGIKKITLQNSDKIVIVGDSYTSATWVVRNKAYISNLGLLTDWRFESFSKSGDDYGEMNTRVQNNTPRYHSTLGIREYGGTYALLISNTNDFSPLAMTDEMYLDNLNSLCESVKALGMRPIICTELGSPTNYLSRRSLLLSGFANENGYGFIDINNLSMRFNYTQYNKFWAGDHGNTRIQALWTSCIKGYINSLPRQKQSIKVYRKRENVAINNISELLFSNKEGKIKKFKEIGVGHHSLIDNKTYDDITNWNANVLNYSEYLMLQNGENVQFSDYGLIEIITPTTANFMESFALNLNDTGIKVYGKHAFKNNVDTNKYFGFNITNIEGINVNTGDKYKCSQDNATYTVVEKYNGNIVMTPYKIASYSSGTLTKVSGVGDDLISYNSAVVVGHSSWYNSLNSPKFEWNEIAGVKGVYNIEKENIKDYLEYDKITFLIYKSGGFNLNKLYATWEGEAHKVQNTKKEVQSQGIELLQQMNLGTATELESWETGGIVTPIISVDGVHPHLCSGCVELGDSNYIEKTLTFDKFTEGYKEIEVRVWTRYFPNIYNSGDVGEPPITEDTFDYGSICLEAINSSSRSCKYTDLVGLHWQESVFTIFAQPFSTMIKIKVYAKDKILQVAKVSAKLK